MTLRVSGKNINIGEALRTHVTDRLNTLTGKYFDGAVTGHVTISPEGTGFRADCSLHLTSGMLLQADGRAQDPYAAFDQSAERIEKRLRRYKSRLKSHHDHDAAKAETVASYVLEAPDQEQEAPAEFNAAVIAESTTQLRRRSVSQAVLDLDRTRQRRLSQGGSKHRLDRHAGRRVDLRRNRHKYCLRDGEGRGVRLAVRWK
jgi:ribosomal subunit interface protein